MALSDIQLINRALLKIGANKISALDEGSAEAIVAGDLYGLVRDALLSAYPWSFATKQVALEPSETEPVADYTHAFDLPEDFLRTLSAGSAGKGEGLTYRIIGKTLQTSADTVTLTYIFRPEEADCPPFFDAVLVTRMAAELSIPLTESTSRAESLYKISEDEFRRARLIDSQQDTPRALSDFTLIDARQ